MGLNVLFVVHIYICDMKIHHDHHHHHHGLVRIILGSTIFDGITYGSEIFCLDEYNHLKRGLSMHKSGVSK